MEREHRIGYRKLGLWHSQLGAGLVEYRLVVLKF
jgi:hypothetical protein